MDWNLEHVWQKPLIVASLHVSVLSSRDNTIYPTKGWDHTHNHIARVYICEALFQLDVTMNWIWANIQVPSIQGSLPWTLSPFHGLEHEQVADDPVFTHADLNINLRAGRRRRQKKPKYLNELVGHNLLTGSSLLIFAFSCMIVTIFYPVWATTFLDLFVSAI